MIFFFLTVAALVLALGVQHLLYRQLQERERRGQWDVACFQKENAHLKEKIEFLTLTRCELQKTLQDLCNQALLGSHHAFLSSLSPLLAQLKDQTEHHFQTQTQTIQHVTEPLQKTLTEMSQHIHQMEQNRVGAYASLHEQVSHLIEGQKHLGMETNHLVTALRTPHIRGCWGEMQLRRVVELAGMIPYCDFQEQVTLTKEDQHVRPDLIIHLSNDKSIIVDAKVPLLHYLEASSANTHQEYQDKLKAHAHLLLSHIKQLSEKRYWTYPEHSVEFVLLFLPGEAFLSSALQVQPDLLEIAAEHELILATPVLLIALLKIIAQGWRHQHLSQQTQRIVDLGKQLHQQFCLFEDHFIHIGKALKQADTLYQKGTHTFNHAILPLVHTLGDTGVAAMTPLKKRKKSSVKKEKRSSEGVFL